MSTITVSFAAIKAALVESAAQARSRMMDLVGDDQMEPTWDTNGPQGEKGDPGDAGPPGPQGEKGDKGECGCCDQKAILVSTDYNILPDDFYIGVNSEEATTQTLPAIDTVDQCIIKTIKVSMGPP